ncbi:hypothetical protein HC081234_17430 [Helicobacter cinaedi]|nr:hypothetical protein HC081234_17430 [Helicobacter cinaedi]
MYSRHKKIALALFVIVFAISLICNKFFGINIRESLMQNFITFLSIVLGFYTASISALYGSKYLGKIYDTIDTNNNKNLLIHTLQSYFRVSIYFGLITLCVLFAASIFSMVENNILLLNSFVKAIIISMICLNVLFMYFITRILITSLLVEGKEISSNQN